MAKIRLWRFIRNKHYQTGQKLFGTARFIPKRAPLWGDTCLLRDAAIKSQCTAKRGKAAELAPVNYLGMVRGIQPEWAERGDCLTGAWCQRRRPRGHHLGPSPLPSAAPVTCPSAIGISSLRDCSWVSPLRAKKNGGVQPLTVLP